jgi:hypothetical protein
MIADLGWCYGGRAERIGVALAVAFAIVADYADSHGVAGVTVSPSESADDPERMLYRLAVASATVLVPGGLLVAAMARSHQLALVALCYLSLLALPGEDIGLSARSSRAITAMGLLGLMAALGYGAYLLTANEDRTGTLLSLAVPVAVAGYVLWRRARS